MQTSCPNCSNRLMVDDAKVPPTPFMLKCPKCQGMVKLPGRGAQPAASAPAPAARPPAPPSTNGSSQPSAPPPQAAAPAPGAPRPPQQVPPAPSSWSPSGMPNFVPSLPASPPANPVGKALVSFAAPDQANAVSAVLTRLGFAVEQLDASDDKLIRLQQGDYDVVASARNGMAEDRNPYRLAQLLPPEVRRRLFLLLVGDDLQTGEGNQAFALLADLVINSKDAPQAERLVLQALHERRRLFQTFWDVEDRKTEGRL